MAELPILPLRGPTALPQQTSRPYATKTVVEVPSVGSTLESTQSSRTAIPEVQILRGDEYPGSRAPAAPKSRPTDAMVQSVNQPGLPSAMTPSLKSNIGWTELRAQMVQSLSPMGINRHESPTRRDVVERMTRGVDAIEYGGPLAMVPRALVHRETGIGWSELSVGYVNNVYTAFFGDRGGGPAAVETLQVLGVNEDPAIGVMGTVNVFLKSNCLSSIRAQNREIDQNGNQVISNTVTADNISLADLQQLLGRFVGTPAFKRFLYEVEQSIQQRGGPSAREAFAHWDEFPDLVQANERDRAEVDPDPILRKLRLIRMAHIL